jgi:glycerol-3-phosphate dehydrogenase subunit C
MDCCGMGGSLGYKENFYDKSIELGMPLIKKIIDTDPHAVITECLSCRLQFQHQLPYPVYHPIEILLCAYEGIKTKERE